MDEIDALYNQVLSYTLPPVGADVTTEVEVADNNARLPCTRARRMEYN